jgi:hypothetical protein
MAEQPYVGLDLLTVGDFEITLRRTTLGRTHLNEWQHTTLTRDKHPCSRRDSNPQSQQASGRRPKRSRGHRDRPPYLLRVGIPSGFLRSSFASNTLYTFLLSPMRVTCPAHLIVPIYMANIVSLNVLNIAGPRVFYFTFCLCSYGMELLICSSGPCLLVCLMVKATE